MRDGPLNALRAPLFAVPMLTCSAEVRFTDFIAEGGFFEAAFAGFLREEIIGWQVIILNQGINHA